jgi:hypothetical protein
VEIIYAYMPDIVHKAATQGITELLVSDINIDLSTVNNVQLSVFKLIFK